nr:tetratricopeptide repeat protein [candidate division Zixibacteria bacterium]
MARRGFGLIILGLLYIAIMNYEAMANGNDEAHRLYKNGVFQFMNGKYDLSCQLFKEAISADSTNAYAYNALGMVFFKFRDYIGAEKYFETAIKLDSQLALAWYNLGNAHYYTPDHDNSLTSKAIEYWTKVLDIEPEGPLVKQAYNNIGNANLNLGFPENAVMAFQNALKIDSVFTEARFGLAQSYEAMGQLEKATGEYQKILIKNPMHAPSYNALGNIFYARGNIISAINSYLQVINVDSSDCHGYRILVTVLDVFIDNLQATRDKAFIQARYINRYRDYNIFGGRTQFASQTELDSALNLYRSAKKDQILQLFHKYRDDFFQPGRIGERLKGCLDNIRLDPNSADAYYRYVKNLDALCLSAFAIRLDVIAKAKKQFLSCNIPNRENQSRNSLLAFIRLRNGNF